jgi:hypothetical protein
MPGDTITMPRTAAYAPSRAAHEPEPKRHEPEPAAHLCGIGTVRAAADEPRAAPKPVPGRLLPRGRPQGHSGLKRPSCTTDTSRRPCRS